VLVVAAFCPSEQVVADLRRTLEAADHAAAAACVPVRPRRRWFARGSAGSEGPTPAALVTAWSVPIIPVVRFGNLTSADAARVVAALTDTAAAWVPAEVLVESIAIDPSTPGLVRGYLGGATGFLADVARDVAVTAAGLNLYLDRRLFHPELDLASIDTGASAERRAALGVELARFPGSQTWTLTHLSMMRQSFGEGTSYFVESDRIRLGLE